MVEGKVVPLLN